MVRSGLCLVVFLRVRLDKSQVLKTKIHLDLSKIHLDPPNSALCGRSTEDRPLESGFKQILSQRLVCVSRKVIISKV